MEETYYPPGAFYFSVQVLGSATPLALLTGVDASFQEVSGITAEFGVEEVAEGGENRFVHHLPRQAKYPNLSLKRGIVTRSSLLAEWAGQTIGSRLSLPIITQNILVMLLGESGLPLIAWAFVNAYPVKWDVAALDSQDNKILTETLELSYNYFDRLVLGSAASVGVKLAQLAARLASGY
jgi:phage tail-like protein